LSPLFVPATPAGNHGGIRQFVKSAHIVMVKRIDLLTNTPAWAMLTPADCRQGC
jgi:hypothetical protein